MCTREVIHVHVLFLYFAVLTRRLFVYMLDA